MHAKQASRNNKSTSAVRSYKVQRGAAKLSCGEEKPWRRTSTFILKAHVF